MSKKTSHYIQPYLPTAIFSSTLKILSTVGDLALPYITAIIIDEGIATQDFDVIMGYGVLMLVISVASMLITLVAHYYASKISQSFAKDLRNDMFEHIQTFSLKEVDIISSSSLITRITNDVYQLQHLFLMTMRMFMRTPALAIGGTIMAFMLDFKLSLILLIMLPFLYLVMQYTVRRTGPIYRRLQKNLDALIVVIRENLTGVKVIKAFGNSELERNRFKGRSATVRDTEMEAGLVLATVNPIITLIMNIAAVAVIYFGGVRVNIGEMQTGEIVAMLNYLTLILNSFINISRIFSMITRSSASSARINELFATENSVLDPESEAGEHRTKIALEFKNVSFAYPKETANSIENISFSIERGKTLAIIGPTGCGKSTIVNLIMRFYDVQDGEIRINGNNIKDLFLGKLREKISVILQQTTLFYGTIQDNIRWGNQQATDEELEKAANIAQIDQYIEEQLPDGYQTVLSQGAVNLSGGQRQRISIARAVIKHPELLIMDDCSSALDFATDLRLRQSIKQQLDGITVLLIAQRITAVMNADKILVLDKGKVIGYGNHAKLMEECSIYREIYESQVGKELIQ